MKKQYISPVTAVTIVNCTGAMLVESTVNMYPPTTPESTEEDKITEPSDFLAPGAQGVWDGDEW